MIHFYAFLLWYGIGRRHPLKRQPLRTINGRLWLTWPLTGRVEGELETDAV